MQTSDAQDFQVVPVQLSWMTLLRVSVYGELALLITTMIALHDVLAAALTLILLAGLGLWVFSRRGPDSLLSIAVWGALQVVLLRIRGEWLGLVILVFLFADMGFYTLTGAATNLANGTDWYALALPTSLATFALTGFFSALAVLFAHRHAYVPSRVAHDFAIAVLFTCVFVLVLGIFMTRRVQAAPRAATLKLTVQNLNYSTAILTAPNTLVSVSLENKDLFWHTFTIDALSVDLKVPMQATGHIEFSAPPGTYAFHCTIPGHEILGMHGTLVVR